MRKYSIAVAGVLLAALALADPCPTALTSVAARVAALRGLAPAFSPQCRIVSSAGLRAELDRKLRRDLPLQPELFLEALVRLGMIEGEPAPLYQRLLDFYTGQVLGYYEPATDEMVIVDRPATGGVETGLVWAHELAHAAQEHRFHLPSRVLALRGDSDLQRALSAVVEGEAMLVALVLQGGGRDSLEQAAAALPRQASELKPPGIPDFFVRDTVFPYSAGFGAVLAAYRHGDWHEVDALMRRPPASTAQLLHPGRSAPHGVPASELPPVPRGWQDLLTDTFGEWTLAFLLERRLPAATAATLAAVWDGDRMRLIRSRRDAAQWALAWRVRCRDEDARRSLEAVLRRVLPDLFAGFAPPDRARFDWLSVGPTVELRLAWPQPVAPPP